MAIDAGGAGGAVIDATVAPPFLTAAAFGRVAGGAADNADGDDDKYSAAEEGEEEEEVEEEDEEAAPEPEPQPAPAPKPRAALGSTNTGCAAPPASCWLVLLRTERTWSSSAFALLSSALRFADWLSELARSAAIIAKWV